MKTIISIIALWLCFISVSGQTAVPDTVYIYETVIVYDTIFISDTVRIKRVSDIHLANSRRIDINFFASPTKKTLLPTATFSENSIILHENNKNYKLKNVKTMKFDLTNFLSATILTAQSIAGISAQETKPADDMMTFPMHFSIVYPVTTQGDKANDYRYNFSFNLFSGKVGAITGVEFGGLFNHVENDVTGVQFGGLVNRAQELTGAQFGGLGNVAKTVTGAQFGGWGNISKDVTGAQFGGIFNIAESVNGVQFGGITNISKEVSGASFGGIINLTGTLRGVHFGLVNVIDTIESGVSIGLINIVKRGFYSEWSLTFADYQNVGLSYKMGTQKFYTIFTAGANFMEDNLWVFGYGFGNRTVLSKRFDFQPEIVSYQYFPYNFKNIQNASANHLKLGFVYKMNDRLGITVAPSLYHFYNEYSGEYNEYFYYEASNYPKISPFSPFYKNGIIFQHSIGAGISVGLIFR